MSLPRFRGLLRRAKALLAMTINSGSQFYILLVIRDSDSDESLCSFIVYNC